MGASVIDNVLTSLFLSHPAISACMTCLICPTCLTGPISLTSLTSKKYMYKYILLSAAMLIAPVARADEAVSDTLRRVIDLDEVIVVSQPKEIYRLRQQAMSSSVFTTEQMQMRQIRDVRDMSLFVPSFAMPNYGSRYTSSMYIRGIGSRINNPAVGMYIDNVPLMTKSAFNQHLYDVDRVDILRGPQGTLYGINTEGGLIRMFTKNPVNYQGTDIRIGGGSYGYRRAELTHYHKPADSFAFSAALFYNGTDGYLHNANLDRKADGMNEFGGRMRAILTPAGGWTFDLTADFQHTKQDGFSYGLYDAGAESVAYPSTTFMSGYRRDMLTTGLNIRRSLGGMLFTSMTSWQWLNDKMLMDQDYLPQDYMALEQRQVQNSLTEELVLRSNDARRWQWVNGVMLNHQWLRTAAPVSFGPAMTGYISQMIEGFMPPFLSPKVTVGMSVPEMFHTPVLNVGAYHESTFSLTPRLRATLGLRLDYSRLKVDYDATALVPMTVSVTMGGKTTTVSPTVMSRLLSDDSSDFLQLLPKASLSYLFGNSGSNVYASFSKGFRAGGYNIQMFSDILQTEIMGVMAGMKDNYAQLMKGDYEIEHTAEDYSNVNSTIRYKPEETWNYEAGAHVNLFDRRLQIDLAAYYTRITNQQLSVMAGDYGYGRMMVNAGKSESKGVEIGMRGKAMTDRLDWSLAYGYTYARFKEYDEYNGNYVPFVPLNTFSAAADYTLPLSSSSLLTPHSTLVFGLNLVGQGKTYWDEANTLSQDFYATLGAHVDFCFKSFVVSLWGKNLTDTNYNTFVVRSSATREPLCFAQIGAPVTFGADVRITIK